MSANIALIVERLAMRLAEFDKYEWRSGPITPAQERKQSTYTMRALEIIGLLCECGWIPHTAAPIRTRKRDSE